MRVVLMEEKVTAREIGAYIELKKRVAEEEYKLEYVKSRAGDHSALISDLEEELREDRSKLKIIDGKLEGRGIAVVVPNQREIEEIGEMLSRLPEKEVQEAMRKKSGSIYLYLSERGRIMRRNLENRNEIGKLNILLANSPEDVKRCVRDALVLGEPGAMGADLETGSGRRIVQLLNRVGVRCSYSEGKLEKSTDNPEECRVVVNNEYFWVPKSKVAEFTENEKLLAEVSVKLQVKNAEMQAITFNEEQQKEFRELQCQYMEHLKTRREVIGKEEAELSLSI